MRNKILHLLLLFFCFAAGSLSVFAADSSESKCGTPAAGHTYRYLMVYDTRGAAYARSHYGSLEAHAQKGIDKCNQVVRNSNIDAYFELGDIMELTDYTLTDASSSGMSAAGQTIPERSDIRQRWRDGNCHFCALVVYPGGNSLSGNFTLEPLSWENSCGVMDASALSDRYSLIHETGHVFGCHHDRDRDSHEYAVGYLGDKYYTIMSYGHLYPGLQEVPYFSGPDQVYNGLTLGDARTDNARMFREHLDIVDQFTERSKIVIFKEIEETYSGAVVRYLNDNNLVISSDKKYVTLTVTASDVLSISTSEKWMNLTANRSEGSMDYHVNVNITESNYGNAPRKGKIIVQSLSDPSFVKELTVIQNCPNGVVVSPTEYVVTSEAQPLNAKFKADGSGTLRSETSWITVGGKSSANFSADCTMSFEVAANTTGQDRVGTLKAYREESQSVTVIKVTQKAASTGFDNFTTTSLSFDSRKQTKQINFFAGQAFSITAPSWVTCTKTSETGNVTVNVNVEANTTGSTRSGDIRFATADGKDTRVVRVSQTSATSYVVDVEKWNPNCRAQNKLIHLTTGTHWQVDVDDPYGNAITVSPKSGTGDATIDVKITENGGGKPRYFSLTIQGDESCAPVVISIEQAGYDPNAVTPDPEVDGGGTGGGKDPETPVDGTAYTIRLDNSGTPLYLTTNEVKDNNNTTYSLSTTPEEFYIVSSGKGFTLQSVSSKKYVGFSGGNSWDCYNVADVWTIGSIEGASTTILKDGSIGLGVDNASNGEGVFTDKPSKTGGLYHWIIEPSKGVNPDLTPCATPVISISGGALSITCATKGAIIYYTLTAAQQTLSGKGVIDASSLSGRNFVLTAYATADGYSKSATASCTLSSAQVAAFISTQDDIDGDGKVTKSDVEALARKVLSNAK